jgi:hypothetical protein
MHGPTIDLLTTRIPIDSVIGTLRSVPRFLVELHDVSVIADGLEQRISHILDRVPNATRALYEETLQDLEELSLRRSVETQVYEMGTMSKFS